MGGKCLIVLGMHRSGTSALTGVLSNLGIDTGTSLSPADYAVNPKGFWEHQKIVAIHEELLASIESSWDDERPLPKNWWRDPSINRFKLALHEVIQQDFAQSVLWAVKDPRLSRLLPLWIEILNEIEVQPLIVITVRHPYEVARSLEKRDGFIPDKSYLLWLRYLIEMEAASRELPRVLVTYEQLLMDWRQVVQQIAKSFSLLFDINDHQQNLIENFLEPSLRHYEASEKLHNGKLAMLAYDAYHLATTTPLSSLNEELAELNKQLTDYATTVGSWACRIRYLEKENNRLSHQNACLSSETTRLKSTISWRITKPIRFTANLRANLLKSTRRIKKK